MDQPIVNFLKHYTLGAFLELLKKYGTCTAFNSESSNNSSIKDKIFVGSISKVCSPKIMKNKGKNKKPTNVLVLIAESLVADKEQSKQPIRIVFLGNVVRELLSAKIQKHDAIAILNPGVFSINYSKMTLLSLSVGPLNVVLWFCRDLKVKECNPTAAKHNTTVHLTDINSDDSIADPCYNPEQETTSSVSTIRPNTKETIALAEEESIANNETSDEHSDTDLSVSVANNNRYRTLPIDLEKGSANTNLIQHPTQSASNASLCESQQTRNPIKTNNKKNLKNKQITGEISCDSRTMISERNDLCSSLKDLRSSHLSVVNEKTNNLGHSDISNECSHHSHSNCRAHIGCCTSRHFCCGHGNSCFFNVCHHAHHNCQCCIPSCHCNCSHNSLEKNCSCAIPSICSNKESNLDNRSVASSTGKSSRTQMHCQQACACINMRSCCFSRVCPTQLSCCNYQKSGCLPETSCRAVISTCCCNCSRISKNRRNNIDGHPKQSFNADSTDEMERVTRTENWLQMCIPHSQNKQPAPVQLASSSSSSASNSSSQFQDFIRAPTNNVTSNHSNLKRSHGMEEPIRRKKKKLFNKFQTSGIISERSLALNDTESSTIHSIQFPQQALLERPHPVSIENAAEDRPATPLKKTTENFNETQQDNSSVIITEAPLNKSSEIITEISPKQSILTITEASPRTLLGAITEETPHKNSIEVDTETLQEQVILNEPNNLEKPDEVQANNMAGNSLLEEDKSMEVGHDLSQISTKSNETIDLEQENAVKDNMNLSRASSDDTFHEALSSGNFSQTSIKSSPEQWTIKDINEITAYADSAKKLSQLNVTGRKNRDMIFSFYEVYPLKTIIINMIPKPENVNLLIKGICHNRCRSPIFYSEFSEVDKIETNACSACKYRTHYVCPACQQDGLKNPLCIFYSFELHLLVNDIVLRVEVTHVDAVTFLGSPPSVYLRSFKKFGKRINNIICGPDWNRKSSIFLNAKIKPKKKNGITILTLCNTSLNKHLEQNGSLYKWPIIK